MLKCGRYEDLVMRYFDNDLSGQERKKLDQHLDACSSCRLLLSQLSGILNTLENTESPKPGPDLERLVMEQVMLLPVQLDNNEAIQTGQTDLRNVCRDCCVAFVDNKPDDSRLAVLWTSSWQEGAILMCCPALWLICRLFIRS